MTSSIYPQPVSIDFVGFVTSLSVTSSSGYSGTATVTFDGDTDPVGILAVANATIDVAGTVSSITVTNEGAGYTSVPSIGSLFEPEVTFEPLSRVIFSDPISNVAVIISIAAKTARFVSWD